MNGPYIEAHPRGDGHDHECTDCGGTVGESDSLLVVDGEPYHEACYEGSL